MKVMFVYNSVEFINFTTEIIESFANYNNKIILVAPFKEKENELKLNNITKIDVDIKRRSKNPFSDIKLYFKYKKILKKEKPDIVYTFTIKPNIYMGIACNKLNIPFIARVSGLGSCFQKNDATFKIIKLLYKKSFKEVKYVFFENKSNQKIFNKKIMYLSNSEVLPGSGINLEKFKYLNYPNSKTINITYLGRIMKDKGFDELLEAISYIGNKYNNVLFHIVGFYEEKEYETKILELEEKGYLKYHGKTNNVIPYIEKSHAIINPSYHEGLSNVLLEAAASGRPVLASKIPGCIETFEEGVTGLGFNAKDTKSLILTIEKFLSLSNDERKEMGVKGRFKIKKEFDRNIVINAYLDQINKILKGK